jgi:Ca2+-binding EF-hand superfamily protein
MDSFERREATLRAQQKWAVVKKSVLPEKDEFLEKANKGKTEEWLEHWNKRRKTQTKLKGLMQHLRLAIRDFDVKKLFVRFTEGNKYPPKYPKSKKVPLWRPANKTSLTAILHMLNLNLTKEEVILARDYFMNHGKTTNYHDFVFYVKAYIRMHAHHKKKKKDEEKSKKKEPPTGKWKHHRNHRTGQQVHIWVKATKEKSEARKRQGLEAAVDEVMNKIREMAKKKKNFDLKAAFEKFDVNADGTIEPHELNMVLREIGIELNQQEMDLVFARFDPDGGGDIEYQEFAWVFNNRRALKKAAQGKHSNLGKAQSLPNINKKKKAETKQEDQEDEQNKVNNLTVKRPERRRKLIGNTKSMGSLKGSRSSGSIKLGSINGGDSGVLPPLNLDSLSQSGQGMLINGGDSLVEKPEIKLGASTDMLQARILSAWCQSQGQLPADSVRLERAADICMAKIREISVVDDKFDLKRAFKQFDIDGNGVVDKDEFVQCMRSFDNSLTPHECLAAYERFDPDGDGVINYEEFSWTFFNRRTFSEATKKLKRRFASQILDRREAAQAKDRIARQLEVFFSNPECAKVFKLYENHERLHDLTSLYAILFQLPLNFSKKEVLLLMEQIEDGLRTPVTFPQFRQICKHQRRNCSVARQAIDENNGAHRGPAALTKFNAPICRVDDRTGSDDENSKKIKARQKATMRSRR